MPSEIAIVVCDRRIPCAYETYYPTSITRDRRTRAACMVWIIQLRARPIILIGVTAESLDQKTGGNYTRASKWRMWEGNSLQLIYLPVLQLRTFVWDTCNTVILKQTQHPCGAPHHRNTHELTDFKSTLGLFTNDDNQHNTDPMCARDNRLTTVTPCSATGTVARSLQVCPRE